MNYTAIRIAALLLLAACLAGPSHAADPGSSISSEEKKRQEQIYYSRGEQRPEGYVVDRSLLIYKGTLPSGFASALAGLDSNNRWLDIGAGTGQAILDYCLSDCGQTRPAQPGQPAKKARAVAMSIEDRRTPLWYQTAAGPGADRIEYLYGKRLREYAPEELGKFTVITDVIGGFSYTENPSLFIERVLSLLEVGGSFYTLLQDVHSEVGTNKPYYEGAPYLTEIANAAGAEIRICSWLKSITCVEVTCELKPDWKPPIETYSVRKICEPVTVPPLVPVHFTAGTPPERGYRLAR
jgi:SAM-dependent methyltransferase